MRRDRLVRTFLRERYLVTTTDGETFDGVMVDADDNHLIFTDVEVVAKTGDRVKVDGELWLPRLNVAYMQRPRT